ncbi:MAG: transporter substrate-binding domain-containing protein [Verrucomicrobiota bacterium]|nr:transporter substrate-binding domain-containing protein [Verrucomicrobiota bacterium]
MRKTILFPLFAALIAAFTFPGCSQGEKASKTVAEGQMISKIRTRGVLKIGVAIFVPWVIQGKDGNLKGFEVELANQLAADMQVKPQFVISDFDQLIPKLQAGEIDIIISGMSITPERALKVNFTVPYNESGTYIVGNKKSMKKVEKPDDLNDKKYVIGFVAGTIFENTAQKIFTKAELHPFSSDDECYKALNLMQIDAVISSSPRPELEVLMNPDKFFIPFNDSLTNTGQAMVIQKGDPDFVNFLNSWIFYYTANQWLLERRHYWFRTLDWKDADVTFGLN